MPIEYFPPKTASNQRPPLPDEPTGTWARLWLQTMWETRPERYRAMPMLQLRNEAASKQEIAEELMLSTLRDLEKAAGPPPSNPADALVWRAPLANQAREVVYESLLAEFASPSDPL
jgi:hypothetical protein